MAIDYIWPDTNVNITHLPLDNPLCANDTCLAFAEAHEASQTLISWGSQFRYGWYVLFFWGIILGGFTLIASARRLHYFHASRSSVYFTEDKPTVGEKFVAYARSFTYRRASGRIADFKKLPSLGPAVLVFMACLFSVLICFVQHPYYRHSRGYGSPSLGVRAGLAGTAMTPVVVGLSGKYNLITLLTGISHEKLNYLHRWCGMIYLFFGIVHTVPFLINDYASGGSKRLYYQFYYTGSMEYTGIAPLAVLVFLCLFSAPWFRQVCYELFVHSHIAAAIAYLGTMFWHCDNTGDSWIYLWATVAIWFVQLVARFVDNTYMLEFRRRSHSGTAVVRVLDDELDQAAMLRFSVQTSLYWTPGQHAFLRFPKLAILDNHPFTIASVPRKSIEKNKPGDHSNELLFLVRPYTGITKRLLQHASRAAISDILAKNESSSTPHLSIQAEESHHVLIDGPYGGLEQHRAMHRLYDHIVLVAGGGGISAMLPWLTSLSRQIADLDEPCRVQRVDLIWCIRHASAQKWIEEELRECLRLAGQSINVDVYVTDGRPEDISNGESDSEGIAPENELSKDAEINVRTKNKERERSQRASSPNRSLHLHAGRPYLPSLLPSMVSHRRTIIMGCGPESLKIDLSNTAARLQSKVISNDADEIVLHTETFGW